MTDPAVCLTFDDRFCANWYAARDVFAEHDMRATFCVHGLQDATEAELSQLRDLAADGHEIACHSRSHPRLQPYLDHHGIDAWVTNEALADRDQHRALGFPGTAFASPFHHATPETRARCAALFTVTRGAGPLRAGAPDLGPRLYTALPADRTLDNLAMLDVMHPAVRGWAWLDHCLDALAGQGGVAVLCGHDIRPERDEPGFYLTRRQLVRLCRAIRARGIETLTLTEAAGRLSTGVTPD